jgi:hypothetical protein
VGLDGASLPTPVAAHLWVEGVLAPHGAAPTQTSANEGLKKGSTFVRTFSICSTPKVRTNFQSNNHHRTIQNALAYCRVLCSKKVLENRPMLGPVS